MSLVNFPEYTPDTPDIGGDLTVATNVFPRTAESYGPIAGLTVFSGALTARCQGAIAVKDNATPAAISNFAGDASKIYKLSNTTWDDKSKAGGYTTGTTERWSTCQWGLRVFFTNFADAIQTWLLGTSALFADLSADAPKARYIAGIRDWIMVANTSDGVNGAMPDCVWWPKKGDPTTWPTVGSATAQAAQSDLQNLRNSGNIIGIVGAVGGADGVVIGEKGIYTIQHVGPPATFQFDWKQGLKGGFLPGSIINLGPFVFYAAEDGFYLFDGQVAVPIGAGKVDKFFYADLDTAYPDRIWTTVDPINKLVFVAYPGAGNQNGNPNHLLIYNWALQRWSYAEPGNLEIIWRSISPGTTLEALDSISSSIDALPFSLDARQWAGGQVNLSAFDANHKLNYFNGDNLAATVETGEIAGDGRRIWINGIRPLVDGGSPTVAIRYRETPQASLTTSDAQSPGVDGYARFRLDTRYARARVTVPAGASWTHLIGIEPEIFETGVR